MEGFLSEAKLATSMSPTALADLEHLGRRRYFKPGEVIMQKRYHDDSLFESSSSSGSSSSSSSSLSESGNSSLSSSSSSSSAPLEDSSSSPQSPSEEDEFNPERCLCVIVSGEVRIDPDHVPSASSPSGEASRTRRSGAPPVWLGAGDFFGEMEFIMGTPPLYSVIAQEGGATIWCLPRSYLLDSRRGHAGVLTLTLCALGPYINERLKTLEVARLKYKRDRSKQLTMSVLYNSIGKDTLEILEDNMRASPTTRRYIESEHPMINNMARLLRGKDDWETATNVWQFVQTMPYRFGNWNYTASQILKNGWGMCTSKAILQTALLEACGLEAGVVETKADIRFVTCLMPSHYRKKLDVQKNTTVHYFCVVKLDGRWVPCDASFSKVVLHVYARAVVEFGFENEKDHSQSICREPDIFHRPFGKGKPCNYVAIFSGKDPYEGLQPLSQERLDEVMKKNPFFDIDNYGALNIKLDKMQGLVFDQPGWTQQAVRHLSSNPAQAFEVAYAGILRNLTNELHMVKKMVNSWGLRNRTPSAGASKANLLEVAKSLQAKDKKKAATTTTAQAETASTQPS